ncbi:MAG: epimerase / dehydratase, partial [Dehalococcoidia bacterium]|nr:epimerase / dehydratase [Dehalococcoidia bacterium]
MKIVTAAQMREIDRRAEAAGLSTQALMENAGRAVAREVRGWLGRVAGVRMLAMVGPGNNGGDGLVAARHLHDWGADIIIYLLAPRSHDDRNLALLRERRIPILTADQDPALEQFSETLSRASVVMDAILGTGRSRPLSGIFKEALERVGEEKARRRALQVVAVDLSTGINADTGALDPACVLADLTVTLAFPKLGFYSGSAASALGELKIADIGIPEDLAQDVPTELITPQLAAALLPHRPLDSNKGTFGRVMVVAGSINYIGAAALSCVAAGRAGAGLVTLAVPRSLLPIMAAKLTEATFLPLPESQTGHLAAESTQELLEQLP